MKISKPENSSRTAPKKSLNKKGILSREKLLQSAKVLFAEKGFRGVSVREIAARAGVNSALVGYYFGGKQALFNEVYRSYAQPLARERMKMLSALTAKKQKPSVEDVLEAWLFPWLKAAVDPRENVLHVHFTANLSFERWKFNKKAAKFTQRTHAAFIEALHRCLPHVSGDTLIWRLHFIMGAIIFGIRDPESLRAFSKGRCDPVDLETTLLQILPFAVNGIRSPEPEA
jgi:AcrR family transcriptional regulator